MWNRCFIAFLLGFTGASSHAADAPDSRLTATESRWLAAGAPVLAYARRQELPLDIVVQPQDAPHLPPLAMGYTHGRCKLVLSMRGNPGVDAAAASIPDTLFSPVVEAMMAHELGHCWRYVRGAWNTLPAGFVAGTAVEGDLSAEDDPEWAHKIRQMRETRREEGFSDLVALAWTHARHPARYKDVHRWLTDVRADQPVEGAHHDTRAWVRLAADGRVFSATPSAAANVFEVALPLWIKGLRESND